MALETLAAMPEVYLGNQPAGAEVNKMRARVAQALMMQGTSGEPVGHWTQGLNRVLQGLVGGYGYGQAVKEGKEDEAKVAAALMNLPGMSATPAPSNAGAIYGSDFGTRAPDGMDRSISSGPRSATFSPLIEQPASPYKLAGMAPINSQDTHHTPLDVMMPRQDGLAALRAAMGGQPALSGATPPGATPVQTEAITPPAPVAAAAPAAPAAPAQPVETRPPVQAAAPAVIDPASAQYIKGLMANPQTRAFGMQLYQAAIARAQPQFGFQMTPDGTLIRTDAKKGTVEPAYTADKPPTWGVIGEDQFGNKQYGWIDAVKRTATPVGGGATAGDKPVTITGPDGKQMTIPAGQDPKKFREHVTTATADAMSGKLTEVQAKDYKFANKMELSEKNLGPLEKQGASFWGRFKEGTAYIPGTATAGNYMQSEDYQKYRQARDNFITALLRDESGAAIGTQEFVRYEKELFPQPGDGEKVIEQKREARKVAIEAMKKGAGPSYKSPEGAAPANGGFKILKVE